MFPIIVPATLMRIQNRKPQPPYTGPCVCTCRRCADRMSMMAALDKLAACLCPCHGRGGPGPRDAPEARLQRHDEIERELPAPAFRRRPWWLRILRRG